MSLTSRSYTIPAYWPRSNSFSLANRNDRLSVNYQVWQQDISPEVLLPLPDKRLNLVFLHGSQMSKEVWRLFVDFSFAEWGKLLDKCILIDAVNSGDSAVANRGKGGYFAGWDDTGRDAGVVIRDAINRHEIAEASPLIIIGHSSGGSSSLCLAALEPALVDAVVAMDPVYGIADYTPHVPSALSAKLPAAVLKNALAQSKFPGRDAFEKFINTKFITSRFDPRVRDSLAEGIAISNTDGSIELKQSPALQAGSYLSVLSINGYASSVWKSIKKPVLLLHGDEDDWNPKGSNETLSKLLINGKCKVINGGGHLIFFQRPEATFSAYRDFITHQFEQALTLRENYKYSGPPELQSSVLQAEIESVIKRSKL